MIERTSPIRPLKPFAIRGQTNQDCTLISRVFNPMRLRDVCAGAEDLPEAFLTLRHANRTTENFGVLVRLVQKLIAPTPKQENIIPGMVDTTVLAKRQNVTTRLSSK